MERPKIFRLLRTSALKAILVSFRQTVYTGPIAKRQIQMLSLYRISGVQVCLGERIDSRVRLSAGNKGEITRHIENATI